MHTNRHPGADPSSVAASSACLRKLASNSRKVGGERAPSQLERPFLCVRPKDAQEYRPLVTEDGIQAWPSYTHACDEIINRHTVVALRSEDLSRLFQRVTLVEASRTSPRLSGILKHLVRNSLTATFAPIYN